MGVAEAHATVLFAQVSISQADMQAMGNTITMVTQDGTTITVPAHEAVLSSGETHSVTMVTADGTEGQVLIPVLFFFCPVRQLGNYNTLIPDLCACVCIVNCSGKECLLNAWESWFTQYLSRLIRQLLNSLNGSEHLKAEDEVLTSISHVRVNLTPNKGSDLITISEVTVTLSCDCITFLYCGVFPNENTTQSETLLSHSERRSSLLLPLVHAGAGRFNLYVLVSAGGHRDP